VANDASRTLIKIKTAKQMYNTVYNNISVERLEQIEREREQTYADIAYQRWMKQLNVASMYVDRTLIHNARVAMQDWDCSKLNTNNIVVND
jgi:hypothetical protein